MINEENKHSWCVNAFYGMSGNNDGTTKLCCMYRSQDYSQILGKEAILDHFTKKEFNIVRLDLQNGIRHENCQACWNEEDAGRTSKRQRDNLKYLKRQDSYNSLSYLELNLGNTCNLSCRTCGPTISSGWMNEDYDTNHASNKTFKEYASQLKRFHQSYDNESPFWEDLKTHLPNIKQFDFYGGEPLMSQKMWETLSVANDLGYSKEIEIHYNTNCTHFPVEKLELWKNFKSVNLSFSIDGIDKKFEYMRYPAKWNLALNNMYKFLDLADRFKNIKLSWCITLSTLNIFDSKETIEFYYDHFAKHNVGMYLNLVHGPSHYNIGILPYEIKDKIKNQLESIDKTLTSAWYHIPGVIKFMENQDYNEHNFKKFIEHTKTSDRYRNQNFLETFTDYGKYFSSYFV